MQFTEWFNHTRGIINQLNKIIKENGEENLKNNRNWLEKIDDLHRYLNEYPSNKVRHHEQNKYDYVMEEAEKLFEIERKMYV